MLSKWGVQSTEELEMITDQGILAEIARTFPYDFCRKAAAEKLTDQILLEDIAETDADLEVRCAAAKRISDQAVLIQIARTSTCPHVRMTVAEKILDQTIAQSVFASVLKQPCAPEDYRVREAALKKLSNSSQALLADIAKHDRDVTIQKAAIEKLTDQKLLAEVARSLGQETFWVCMPFSEALARITDPQIAWEIERERDEIHEDRKRRGIDDGEYQP